MNFLLALIPAPYRIAVELALLAAALVAAAACGATVMHWRDTATLQTERAAWAQERTKALTAAVAQRDAAIHDRDALAGRLAAIDADGNETLRRFNHANETLAARADSGAVRVRVVGANCPAAHDVPQAATGGRVDPGASAELGADARRRYFALRGAIGDASAQLATCQQSLGALTGQPVPSSPATER